MNQYDQKMEKDPDAAMPWSLENYPELFLHLTLVWIVFSMVRNSRLITEFSIGSVSLTEICAMLTEFQIDDPDVRLYYIQLIQALDTSYVQYLYKMRK